MDHSKEHSWQTLVIVRYEKMKPTIIAIDPGASGGFAVCENGKVYTLKMPATRGDIRTELAFIQLRASKEGNECVAVIEEIVKFAGVKLAYPQGVAYGRNFGFIEGILSAFGIRLESVRAQQWQKDLGLGISRGLGKTVWKNKLKSKAQELYPALNGEITLKTADALLILEWYLRKNRGPQ